MGFFKDFKAFAMRGNVMDMAVGVVIGSAFGKIVTSMVSDIIMPLVSLAVGDLSFSDWKIVFTEAQYDEAGTLLKAENALNYGNFIQNVVDFLIIAFCIFLAIRLISKLHRKKEAVAEAAPPAPTQTELLLTEIRDLLKKNDAADAGSAVNAVSAEEKS